MIKTKFLTGLATLIITLSLTACGGSTDASQGRGAFEREDDRAKGSADAPITIVEYASVACGGCAVWHENVMPTVDEYIQSGDVRFVMREMLTGQPQLAIAGFMLADCVESERYFDVIDVLFEQQRALFAAMQNGTAQAQFRTIAKSAGLDDTAYRACLTDEARLESVKDRSKQSSTDGVISTPTFFINGEKLEPVANPDGEGQAFGIKGEALIDEQGPILATFEGETFERIILYFKNSGKESTPQDGDAE